MSDTKKPAAKINLHPVSAAIWRNQNPKGVFYSVTFERSYKDEPESTRPLPPSTQATCSSVRKFADLAETKIRELRANDRQSEQSDEEAA